MFNALCFLSVKKHLWRELLFVLFVHIKSFCKRYEAFPIPSFNILLSWNNNFFLLTSFSQFRFLFIIFFHTNTGVFRLKFKEFTEWWTIQKIFPLITMNFASNLLSQGSIKQDSLLKNIKNSVFREFHKNFSFSTEFQ